MAGAGRSIQCLDSAPPLADSERGLTLGNCGKKKKCQKKQECERRDWGALSVSARSALTDMGAPGSPPGLGGGDAMQFSYMYASFHSVLIFMHCDDLNRC